VNASLESTNSPTVLAVEKKRTSITSRVRGERFRGKEKPKSILCKMNSSARVDEGGRCVLLTKKAGPRNGTLGGDLKGPQGSPNSQYSAGTTNTGTTCNLRRRGLSDPFQTGFKGRRKTWEGFSVRWDKKAPCRGGGS